MTCKWGIPRSLWIIQNMSLLLWPVNLKKKDQSSASSTLVDTDRYHNFRAAQNVPANMPMSSVSKTPELITRRPAGSWKCWSWWCRGAKTNEGRRESSAESCFESIPESPLGSFQSFGSYGQEWYVPEKSRCHIKRCQACRRLNGHWLIATPPAYYISGFGA